MSMSLALCHEEVIILFGKNSLKLIVKSLSINNCVIDILQRVMWIFIGKWMCSHLPTLPSLRNAVVQASHPRVHAQTHDNKVLLKWLLPSAGDAELIMFSLVDSLVFYESLQFSLIEPTI